MAVLRIEPPISLDSSLGTYPGSKGEEALDVSECERQARESTEWENRMPEGIHPL